MGPLNDPLLLLILLFLLTALLMQALVVCPLYQHPTRTPLPSFFPQVLQRKAYIPLGILIFWDYQAM